MKNLRYQKCCFLYILLKIGIIFLSFLFSGWITAAHMECILGARGESKWQGLYPWHGANNRIQHKERSSLPHGGRERIMARRLLPFWSRSTHSGVFTCENATPTTLTVMLARCCWNSTSFWEVTRAMDGYAVKLLPKRNEKKLRMDMKQHFFQRNGGTDDQRERERFVNLECPVFGRGRRR